ncbi:MAG: hypothetical protein M3442_19055 [Chloroflexota bacterium]|nr:hypothetical protein [Chloroflexota bacterium]
MASLTVALLVPASTAFGQATPTRPAATPTRAAVGSSPAAGEPIQDATMAAMVLGVMLMGGFALRRYAERRG